MFTKLKSKSFFLLIVLFSVLLVVNACKKEEDDVDPIVDPNATEFNVSGKEVTIIDKGKGVGTKTLSADTTWVLQGLVFVNDGQTLTIEAGTVIKGKPGTGENASALIVARGGKIMAEGTSAKPIILTAYADDLNGSVPDDAKGLWGGLIILGRATSNNSTQEKAIEGIPVSESRGLYGGADDNDNSGTIKYLSIRHGGTDIGEGNEINGLTLGCVGKNTILEHIEVVSNQDDGVEFFGGCPQLKYSLVAFCGDDSYDYDEGFHGKGQFWVAIQDADGDRVGEHDGGPSDNQLGTPYSTPVIYNATYIGNKNGESRLITFRENAGGSYKNSIFVNQSKAIDIEYRQDVNNNLAGSSYKMFEDGNLKVQSCIFYDIAGITSESENYEKTLFAVSVPKDSNGANLYSCPDDYKNNWAKAFSGNSNKIANAGISATNPVPTTPQNTDLAELPVSDSFYENVNYKGAFGTTNWANGWTLTFKN